MSPSIHQLPVDITSPDLTIGDLIRITFNYSSSPCCSLGSSIDNHQEFVDTVRPNQQNHSDILIYQRIVTIGAPINQSVVRMAAIILCRELANHSSTSSHSAALLSAINERSLPIVINKYSDINMVCKLLHHAEILCHRPVPSSMITNQPIITQAINIINGYNFGNAMSLARFVYDLTCQVYNVVLTDDYTAFERHTVATIGARLISTHQSKRLIVHNTLSAYMHDYLSAYIRLIGDPIALRWLSSPTNKVSPISLDVSLSCHVISSAIRQFCTIINNIIIIIMTYSNTFSPDELCTIKDYINHVSPKTIILANDISAGMSTYQEHQTLASVISNLIKSLSVIAITIGKDYGRFTAISQRRPKRHSTKRKLGASSCDRSRSIDDKPPGNKSRSPLIKHVVNNIMISLRTAYSSDNYISPRLLEKICDNIIPSTIFVNMLREAGY